MTVQAKRHDRLRCIAVAWVAWLEAHARRQEEDEEVDDDDDDDLLITYNEQGLIRFTRPRTERSQLEPYWWIAGSVVNHCIYLEPG